MRVGDKIAPLHHPIFKPANLPDFLAVARKFTRHLHFCGVEDRLDAATATSGSSNWRPDAALLSTLRLRRSYRYSLFSKVVNHTG